MANVDVRARPAIEKANDPAKEQEVGAVAPSRLVRLDLLFDGQVVESGETPVMENELQLVRTLRIFEFIIREAVNKGSLPKEFQKLRWKYELLPQSQIHQPKGSDELKISSLDNVDWLTHATFSQIELTDEPDSLLPNVKHIRR